MNRRNLLKAAAGASIVPMAALAQSTGSRDHEAQHFVDTLATGLMALESSRVALGKTSDENVKRFAEFEAAEQETVATVVKAASDARHGAPPTPKIKTEDQMVIDKLKAAPAGIEFDRAYVAAQIEGHQRLLQIQERYLSLGRDLTSRSVAMMARGHIKEHLANLDLLQKQLA